MRQPTLLVRRDSSPLNRRPRRALTPEVRLLEGRRLLTGGPAASAVMTQTATFPDLESLPTVSNQALLYFSATMGTLTEVDLVTSGSFQTQFSAQNLGSTSATIQGTTTANLSINVPTGPMPVSIPAVTETIDAPASDGSAGASGTTLAPVTSSSTPQTTVLTSPADLAAFTGFARIPISVTGHATGGATSSDSDVSTAFDTQTSATITVIYHYIPNPPGTDPVSGGSTSPSPSSGGTSTTPITATGTAPTQGSDQAPSALPAASSTGAGHHSSARTRISTHHLVHPTRRPRPTQVVSAHHHQRQLGGISHSKG
jgi:hypothetical protein